jgi:phosphohistidine phosphatase
MKQLVIIRHAKSSWETPLNDIDRPLTVKGLQDAHLVSLAIVNQIPKSFMIWSSIAKRAAETAVVFSQNVSYPIESISFREDLYTFDEKVLEKVIKTCSDECNCLLVFGHNEAITNFVNKFGSVFIENVATCGFVNIIFDTKRWKDISKGTTQNIIFPKDLK